MLLSFFIDVFAAAHTESVFELVLRGELFLAATADTFAVVAVWNRSVFVVELIDALLYFATRASFEEHCVFVAGTADFYDRLLAVFTLLFCHVASSLIAASSEPVFDLALNQLSSS